MEDNNAPTPSLSRGEYTFMPQRLENILKYERFAAYNETDAGIRKFQGGKYGRPEIRCESSIEYFEFEQCDGGLRCYGDQRARLRAANFCQWLYGHASPVSIEVKELDAALSKVFRFKFDPLTKSHIFVEQACDLLERMPAWPPELLDVPTSIPLGYRASSLTGYANKDRRLWQKLQATTFVNGTVLRFALRAVMIGPSTSSHDLLDIINVVSFLLETVSNLAQSVTHIGTLWRSFIVRAFLWTTWQRCQLIYYHIATIHTLKNGSDDGKIAPLTLRGSFPSPGMTLTEMSKQNSGISKAAYMCGWNFELLRIKSFCIGADFRRFHQRYTSAFGKHTARCFVSQQIACKGESPRSCQRFHGMKIDDQSMHDEYCSGSCTQLIWDESSYRRVSGPRAVRLKRSDHNACESIQYCNASERTLAISHVWSHGQGGRPETGFNYCLHLRYSKIARLLNCDTYWIDATCIPDNHQLRTEAVENINKTFGEAKVMLVCDRDIMELDISDMTTEICETLLVTVAVSDWNTRAWTFLEAFRARRTVHLLCKNNAVVSLQRVMQMVCQKCALEIGILLLAMSHCLPPLDDRELAREKGEARQRFQAGYLEVETSGHLLSHRPASRPGDDVVIWSLLIAEKMIFNNAEAFWNAMKGPILQLSEDTGRIYSRGASISTGYLVSKAPRLKVKGLSWAPATPTFPYSAQSDANGLNSYDEGHTASGNITPDGLVAPWWLWKFDIDGLQQLTNNQRARNLSRIKAQFLEGYLWGAILCPIEEEQGARWWAEGGRLRRNMVAVCATNDIDGSVVEKYTVNKSNPRRVTWDENWDENREAVGWEWRGVYNWDDIEPLPEWGLIKNFLIV